MIIKIGTDRFWVRASNLERWAEILSSLPREIQSKSKKDIAKNYLHYKVDEGGRVVNSDEIYGLFGAEKSRTGITIVGSNFINEKDKGYVLTEGAIDLLNKYNGNEEWEKVLAEQLLKYSVRVRSIVFPLLNGGCLVCEKGYLQNLKASYISYGDNDYYIFSNKMEEVTINNLIELYTNIVLGPFWREELDINNDEIIEIHGVNKKEPSLGSGTYLKIPLLLFNYLEWVKEENEGRYILDKYKIKEDISEETFNSLIMNDTLNEIEELKELIIENSDARGFFPIEKVGSSLKDKIDRSNNEKYDQWIDHYFMTAINNRVLRIVDNEQGQPRHGRGLLGKKDYQLIKLEILK